MEGIFAIVSIALRRYTHSTDFPGGPVIKNPSSNAGDAGLVLVQGTKIP